jgi:formate hydrogenlyase transcriptional activator
MSVITMPSSRNAYEAELEQLDRLALALSTQFTRIRHDEIDPAIPEVLGQIGAALGGYGCRLLEFAESGAFVHAHTPRGGATVAGGNMTPAAEDWLVQRLSRGEPVNISRPDELPDEALATRDRPRVGAVLGIPAPASGQPICALLIQSAASRRWPTSLVERLESMAEILGAALQRRRREAPMRDEAAIERLARLEADNRYLKEEIRSYHDFEEIVGESAPLRLALTRLAQVAPMSSSVLLLGPTGSGKELFARALHERSRRHARPLVRVNCAALPPTLVESELFGHERGAFTGAVGMRQGRFEMADGGTIFLDEIGDLAPDVQVRFLRVLQEGEFERVGSSRTKKVDVRVIAATHHDLEAAVAEGRFRADLYYRLSVYPIRLPSLEERSEDIPRLIWFFINRHQRDLGRRITEIPRHVMEALQSHPWPGNVRELENVVVRAMIASAGNVLQLDDPLPLIKRISTPAGQADNLDAVQRAHIETVLQRCGWRINGAGNAAECLGVHPNTLRFRMKKLGLSRRA